MQKNVVCTLASLKTRESDDDLEDRVGKFVFSVTDSSSMLGKPKEYYGVKIKITGELLLTWGLVRSTEEVLTKVLLYYAADHVQQKVERNIAGDELPRSDEIFLTIKNHTEKRCPVITSEIDKVLGYSFRVDASDHTDEKNVKSLKECLDDFAKHIRSEKRMTFWQLGSVKSKRWIPQPEAHAKNLLHTFLSGRFGNSIYTFEEITSGAGRIDLFIMSPLGEKVVVELKMCGHGYSSTYARQGKEQLSHYMENKETKTGYLLVFDSRVRDFAQGFHEVEIYSGLSLVTILVDLRPYVKLANAPSSV